MTTVCDGWIRDEQKTHDRVVLKDDGQNDGNISHGMCDACQTAMNDPEAAQKTREFAAYIANPSFDPRD